MPFGKKRLRSSSLDRDISKGSQRAPRWPPLHPVLRHGAQETTQKGKVGFAIVSGGLQEETAMKKLLQCQESLSKEQSLRHEAEQKLLELFEENRQLRAKCEKLERPGYTLVENSLLKNIDATFVRFLHLQNMKSGSFASVPLERVHDGKPSEKVNRASVFPVRTNKKLQEGKSSERNLDHPLPHEVKASEMNMRATKRGATKSDPLAPLDRQIFQGFIASKAEKIISDIKSKQSSIAEQDSKSSVPSVQESAVKHPRHQLHQSEILLSAELSANDSYRSSLRETSKRLSEILGIDHKPSKLLPTPTGSPVFFQLESEAASSEYKSDFLPSSSAVSSVSEADEKGDATSSLGDSVSSKTRTSVPTVSSVHPGASKSSSKNSKTSQDATLVSSIHEKGLPSEISAPSSYSHKLESIKAMKSSATLLRGSVTASHQKQQKEQREVPSASTEPSAAPPRQPSESFDIDTADITVSSIYSASGRPERPKGSAQGLLQRHSTPTSADEGEHKASDTVSTPSNISLSRNHSGVSTPSTPDTLTSPQLAGSDFDGF